MSPCWPLHKPWKRSESFLSKCNTHLYVSDGMNSKYNEVVMTHFLSLLVHGMYTYFCVSVIARAINDNLFITTISAKTSIL